VSVFSSVSLIGHAVYLIRPLNCFQLVFISRKINRLLLACAFAQLLMFREFELVMWSYFSMPDKIIDIIGESEKEGVAAATTRVITHLVNTAYFCKRQVVSEEEFEAF